MSDFQKFMAYKMTTEGTGGSNGCGCSGCATSVIIVLGVIFLFAFLF